MFKLTVEITHVSINWKSNSEVKRSRVEVTEEKWRASVALDNVSQ